MTDSISKAHRSWNMSRIRSTGTKPEIVVRSLLHALGYRFRLYGRVNKRLYKSGILPGKPDIVLKKYKTVICVHGCFWHHHQSCKRATTLKTRTQYWKDKFSRNKQRDKQNLQLLNTLGWNVIAVWECEVGAYLKQARQKPLRSTLLADRLQRELSPFVYDQSHSEAVLSVAENSPDYSVKK
ncbi:very short patch repair endonuclease [Psychromonas ossibalaenae]|uniref:very short patch repair endonuclease n=1 Tax=Psychromonas ossibalaenae TaxID=444922 RepID=UPI000372538E|nr:DNA mismatch endonuclease Vsr [Psychromonas ossibalaenae]